MKRWRITVCGVVLLFGISSCATITAPPIAHLKAANHAFVKGMDSSMFALGSTFDVQIKSVDGKSTLDSWSGYSDGLEIPSGQHHLVVLCSMTAEMGNINTASGESNLEVDLVAGHVYQLKPNGETENGGCGAVLSDVTGQR